MIKRMTIGTINNCKPILTIARMKLTSPLKIDVWLTINRIEDVKAIRESIIQNNTLENNEKRRVIIILNRRKSPIKAWVRGKR